MPIISKLGCAIRHLSRQCYVLFSRLSKSGLTPSVFLFFAAFIAPLGLAAEPSIKIGSVTLKLAYAPSDSPIALREYILPGETLQSWTRMASVRVLKKEKKPKKYLDRVGAQVMGSQPLW